MRSNGPAILASEPGKLLVEFPQPDFRGHGPAAFVEALQSFEMLGITRFRRLKDGVIVHYDARCLEFQDLKPVLMAAFSKVSYALGDYSPSTHVLPVTFGGDQGPDLPMACVLLDTPERTLIRRACRTKHTVRTFSAPGASALFEVPWSADWHQNAQAASPAKAAPRGSVTLSPLGVTVTSCSSYTNELVVGRVSEAFLEKLPEIRMGDSVWLRAREWR
ncbi:carboxyltransferase domain-containing protein [Paenarthrobacter sp. RAF54_2]|uniref:carboxyltransferase domain-containing protein n=1 Tax=Paenarthrobacter sp. RAF54_2 TaxID=3233061 RepID=UPI003F954F3F